MVEDTDEELSEKLNTHSGTTAQNSIQFEITKRLKDSVEDFNKSSSKYSKVIMGLTIALFLIALIQIVLFIYQLRGD